MLIVYMALVTAVIIISAYVFALIDYYHTHSFRLFFLTLFVTVVLGLLLTRIVMGLIEDHIEWW